MREIGILFKNENGDNVPYEKPVHKGKFTSIPAIAPDGSAHLQTRIYPEGISYITKLLRKHGYLGGGIMKSYIKCFAILVSNCYSSRIVDERNFDTNDIQGVQKFYSKYADDKYRCFQVVLDN